MDFELINYKMSEKILNTVSHAIGALGYIFILIFLLYRSQSTREAISYTIYSIALFTMFFNSSLYHGVKKSRFQYIMRAIDHSSVFLAIAGTYTPLLSLGVSGILGIIGLVIIWVAAITGIGIKIWSFVSGNVKKTEKLSIAMYLIMGWLSLFFMPALYRAGGPLLILYLALGGIFYTVGVYFYKNKKIKLNHFIWHIFIIFGALFHFMAVLTLR